MAAILDASVASIRSGSRRNFSAGGRGTRTSPSAFAESDGSDVPLSLAAIAARPEVDVR